MGSGTKQRLRKKLADWSFGRLLDCLVEAVKHYLAPVVVGLAVSWKLWLMEVPWAAIVPIALESFLFALITPVVIIRVRKEWLELKKPHPQGDAKNSEQGQPTASPAEQIIPVSGGAKTSPALVDDAREFFIGQWRIEEGNGRLGAYVAELQDGGRAQKISGGMVKNVAGSWGYVYDGGWAMHGQVEIRWDDGTTDVLRVVKIGRQADGRPFEAWAVKIKGRQA
jgi:hypothetical protein